MAIFKRLIQNPSSPDKDLKAAGTARYKQATFARLTDTNALSRDTNDQTAYTLTLTAAATGTQTITSKKGVVKITTTNTGTLTITLNTTSTSELLLADVDKYYVQVSVATATSVTPVTWVVPIAADNNIAVKIAQPGTTTAWGTVYLNYQIIKIGD
jgi:hypothetical protein